MSTSNGTKNAPAGNRTVRFRVLRSDGPSKPSRWEEFDVPVQSSTEGSGSALCRRRAKIS